MGVIEGHVGRDGLQSRARREAVGALEREGKLTTEKGMEDGGMGVIEGRIGRDASTKGGSSGTGQREAKLATKKGMGMGVMEG